MSDPKEKSGKESGQAMDERLLTVNVWGALGDSEMTGQQVRLGRWLMLDLEARLDG